MKALEVTPASEWKPATIVVELPSGRVAELRKKFPAFMLMRSGAMTDDLFAAMEEARAGEAVHPKRAVALVDLIVTTMFVSPSVPGELKAEAVEDEDIEFVVDLAFGGTPDDGFRGEQDGAGDSGDGADVEHNPVESVGDGAGVDGSPAAGHAAGGTAARSAEPRKRAAKKPAKSK